MKKVKIVMFIILCFLLVGCGGNTTDENQDDTEKTENTEQTKEKKGTVVEKDFPDATKASAQILEISKEEMIVQMHYPNTQMGSIETRTIKRKDVYQEKEFSKGEFIKLIFDADTNKPDTDNVPGISESIIDNKSVLNNVYMLCAVLQPREENVNIDRSAQMQGPREISSRKQGTIVDITAEYIEASIGSGNRGYVRLYFKDENCWIVHPCFIGDKVQYDYYSDSIKPVEEDHNYSNFEWVESTFVTTDYGFLHADWFGYKMPE